MNMNVTGYQTPFALHLQVFRSSYHAWHGLLDSLYHPTVDIRDSWFEFGPMGENQKATVKGWDCWCYSWYCCLFLYLNVCLFVFWLGMMGLLLQLLFCFTVWIDLARKMVFFLIFMFVLFVFLPAVVYLAAHVKAFAIFTRSDLYSLNSHTGCQHCRNDCVSAGPRRVSMCKCLCVCVFVCWHKGAAHNLLFSRPTSFDQWAPADRLNTARCNVARNRHDVCVCTRMSVCLCLCVYVCKPPRGLGRTTSG